MLAGYRVWILRKKNINPVKALGLGMDRRSFINLIVGIIICMSAITVIFLVEWGTGLISVTGVNAPTALIDDLFSFVMVAIIEELIFRCGILGGLMPLLRSPAIAIIVSAVIFGVVHAGNANATVLSVISTTVGGLMYGIAYAGTERIWLPFGMHFGWNYAQGRLFGFSLSGGPVAHPPFIQQRVNGPALLTGGAYGPEGGIIGLSARFLVIALVAVWLSYSCRDKGTGTPVSSNGEHAVNVFPDPKHPNSTESVSEKDGNSAGSCFQVPSQ